MNRIMPYFKIKRKYRTVIFGVLPIVLLSMWIMYFILYALLGIKPIVCFIPCLGAAPYYLIVIFAAVFLLRNNEINIPSNRIHDILGHDVLYNAIFIMIPVILYSILFILFLYYCYYYRKKRIKAYKHLKKALTVIWAVISVPVLIFVILFII